MKKGTGRKSDSSKDKRSAKRKTVVLTPDLVEGALRHLLTSTLALFVLNNSRRPASEVIKELMDVEVKAANLVGLVMQMRTEDLKGPQLEGTLAGVFSFIPWPSRSNSGPRDTPRQPKATT